VTQLSACSLFLGDNHMHAMRKTAAMLLALAATTAFADQPTRDQVTQPLYVLRANVSSNATARFQGIFRYDLATKSYTSLTPFQYLQDFGIDGAERLAATSDRIILQGTGYYEFDVASGRLLRRYEATDAATDKWAFHGTIVTEEQARTLGIPSGTYGFPLCTFFVQSNPVSSTCPPHQFPGYSAPTSNPYPILLRRSLDPADLSLTVVKALGLNASFNPPAIALDPPHRQFWLWTRTNTAQWATLPISNGALGDPIAAAVTPTSGFVYSLTFHDSTRSLFELSRTDGNERLLLQRPTADPNAAAFVERSDMRDLTQPRIDSTAAISDPLPDRYVQVVPAIGETPGAGGTLWHSDLWLYNPAADAIDVTLRRVVKPQQVTTRHFAAHSSLALRDVLKTLGGGPSGDGVTTDALVIDAPYRWGAQLAAYSRTYTAGPDGGTYGQSVPAVPSAVGYSNHVRDFRAPTDTEGFPSTIVLDKRDVGRFRHNVGVVNDTGASFDVRLYDGFHKFSIPIAAHSVGNVNLEALFTDSNAVLFAADRPAPVWLSMIDNISGDATFVPFTNFSTAGDTGSELAIPAAGTVHGAGGTSWRTDLYGAFPTVVGSESLDHPFAHLDAATGCGADTHLNGDGPYIYRDVVHQFGACDPGGGVIGALRMRGNSWMQGFSRTYTTRADGGTLGDMLPFYPANGWPLQHFSGLEVGTRFRINAGLYNGSTATTTNRLFLYDANGVLVAQRDVDLGPHASLQAPLASLMNVASLPAGIYGLSVIPNGDGRSWAYVSLVDNISGDPTNFW
jgi:hypothetical protein